MHRSAHPLDIVVEHRRNSFPGPVVPRDPESRARARQAREVRFGKLPV
jgi:hypothetical protein